MKNKITWIKWGTGLALPLALVGLFELLKGDQARMGWWVDHVMAPVEQFLARIWSVFPAFSVAEVLTALVLMVGVVWLIRAVVLLIRKREGRIFTKRLLAMLGDLVCHGLDVERCLLCPFLCTAQRIGDTALFCGDAGTGYRPVCRKGGGVFHPGAAG